MKKFSIAFIFISVMMFPLIAADNSLAEAISEGNIELAEQLLADGADVNSTYYGNTPIEWAMNENEYEFVDELIDRGANVTGTNLAARAVSDGEVDTARKLLDAGADINATYYSSSPIQWAMNEGEYEFVDELIDRGANVTGTNLAARAAADKKFEIAEKLIKYGSEASATYYGLTASEWESRY